MPYVGNQPTTQAFVTDTFNGNGSTTAFTLSVAPATTTSILVAVSGVLQDPSTYSVSGTTLTFSAAPPSGTGNISVRFLGIPASGVTTTAYRTQTEFTATAGQTTFSVPSYTVGYIDVYRNGVLLGSADFTATNGTTVVLAAGASAGDLVETVSFYVSSVVNAIPAVAGAVNSTYLQSGITITSPTISGTYTAGTSLITSGTAVASTSGTSIDFTGIPSWVKRITVMFNGVSTNGSSLVIVQLGTSSGVETSSYLGNSQQGGSPVAFSTGFIISTAAAAASVRYGAISIALLNSNVWTVQGVIADTNNTWTTPMAGVKSLSSTLDRVRITTVNGTDTFDAGTINILYE
jgi:hypothetical protein